MSADNWTLCPRCLNRIAKEVADSEAKTQAAYGKVTPGEYISMLEADKRRRDTQPDSTFREDYEIGVNDDNFVVSYSGSCGTCGLEFKYEYTEKLDVAEPKRGRK